MIGRELIEVLPDELKVGVTMHRACIWSQRMHRWLSIVTERDIFTCRVHVDGHLPGHTGRVHSVAFPGGEARVGFDGPVRGAASLHGARQRHRRGNAFEASSRQQPGKSGHRPKEAARGQRWRKVDTTHNHHRAPTDWALPGLNRHDAWPCVHDNGGCAGVRRLIAHDCKRNGSRLHVRRCSAVELRGRAPHSQDWGRVAKDAPQ